MPRPLLQIYTRVYLRELSLKSGRTATLDDIADTQLDQWAAAGFESIWLLGVWQTGKAGKRVSQTHADWQSGFQECLPDIQPDDICGSPFAITSYTANKDFGGPKGLSRFRKRLNDRQLKLWLDFVPNHTALDHPWVVEHPEYFVEGSLEQLHNQPQNYVELDSASGKKILAHGRDPYFSGWPDTLQLNYRNPDVQDSMKQELAQVAKQCDGVRCDMAMLVLPQVFEKTWPSQQDSPAPLEPFWPDAIAQSRQANPKFQLMAEVYWGLENELVDQGFDCVYDKALYDHLRDKNAAAVAEHLTMPVNLQQKRVRFLENHDEKRAAAVFPGDIHQAAAVITYLAPGIPFFYEGQLDGRRDHASIHLQRRTTEPGHPAIVAFYRKLLSVLQHPAIRNGCWSLNERLPAWEGNPTDQQFIAMSWQDGEHHLLATINYGSTWGQCFIQSEDNRWENRQVILNDLLGPERYQRDGFELLEHGLFLDMPPWGYHVFDIAVS